MPKRAAMPVPPPLTKAVKNERRSRFVELVNALPEAAAKGDQHLSLEVRRRRFGWLLDDHHGNGRLALNCRVAPGVNKCLCLAAPDRFHIPAYVGHRGWLGLWLDLAEVDWAEVQRVLADAYVMTAPAKLVAFLDGGGGLEGSPPPARQFLDGPQRRPPAVGQGVVPVG